MQKVFVQLLPVLQESGMSLLQLTAILHKQFTLGSLAQQRLKLRGAVPEEDEMLQVLEHLFDRDRLGDSGRFSRELKRPWRDSTVTLQDFKAPHRKCRENCFSRASPNWRMRNGLKTEEDKFRLETRKKFLIMRVVKHCHRFPRNPERWMPLSWKHSCLDGL